MNDYENQLHFSQRDPVAAAMRIIQGKHNSSRLQQMLYMDFAACTIEEMSPEDWEALIAYEHERDLERELNG